EYNLSFDTETQMQLLSFPLSFTTELKGLSNGYHTFTYALTEGATDPATVSNAYEREFLVDYHDDDEGPEEPGDDDEDPEEPGDGDGDGEDPTDPEEPGDDEEEPDGARDDEGEEAGAGDEDDESGEGGDAREDAADGERQQDEHESRGKEE